MEPFDPVKPAREQTTGFPTAEPAKSSKSSVQQIRERFDRDVERFSNLETGQSATVDAPLVLELISEAAAAASPDASAVLDVGCGAGNYTLKLLERLPALDVTLMDLSRPMLDRAVQRITRHVTQHEDARQAGTAGTGAPGNGGGQDRTRGRVTALQGDVRELPLPEAGFDVILAAAVLHHLRGDEEWEAVFAKFHRALRPGGSLWVSDLVRHEDPAVQEVMWRRYGQYLSALKGGGTEGEKYRGAVFAYIDQEDSPRPLGFQLDLLRRLGFRRVDVLHKNLCFAAYGAGK